MKYIYARDIGFYMTAREYSRTVTVINSNHLPSEFGRQSYASACTFSSRAQIGIAG